MNLIHSGVIPFPVRLQFSSQDFGKIWIAEGLLPATAANLKFGMLTLQLRADIHFIRLQLLQLVTHLVYKVNEVGISD
ncbi:MAG: hypothetical protein HUJ26_19485 [Planctomycetaceae bacterium]|nr:hypothetical protein [Planctomycetaceae bacterium]